MYIKSRTRLEISSKDWSPITSISSITYSSLPSGKYTFKVKSSNNDESTYCCFTTDHASFLSSTYSLHFPSCVVTKPPACSKTACPAAISHSKALALAA